MEEKKWYEGVPAPVGADGNVVLLTTRKLYDGEVYEREVREVPLDALRRAKVLDDFRGRRQDMTKAMISQPMAGETDEQIVATREKAMADLEAMGYEVVNTLFTDEWYGDEAMEERGVVQVPLCYLAKSLENMSLCHAAYFCKGWENARGCRIEHDAAVAYGLEVIYGD